MMGSVGRVRFNRSVRGTAVACAGLGVLLACLASSCGPQSLAVGAGLEAQSADNSYHADSGRDAVGGWKEALIVPADASAASEAIPFGPTIPEGIRSKPEQKLPAFEKSECNDHDPCTVGDDWVLGVCTPGELDCELACADDQDNNQNGLVDCSDPDCIATPSCCTEAGLPQLVQSLAQTGCLEVALSPDGLYVYVVETPRGCGVGAGYNSRVLVFDRSQATGKLQTASQLVFQDEGPGALGLDSIVGFAQDGEAIFFRGHGAKRGLLVTAAVDGASGELTVLSAPVPPPPEYETVQFEPHNEPDWVVSPDGRDIYLLGRAGVGMYRLQGNALPPKYLGQTDSKYLPDQRWFEFAPDGSCLYVFSCQCWTGCSLNGPTVGLTAYVRDPADGTLESSAIPLTPEGIAPMAWAPDKAVFVTPRAVCFSPDARHWYLAGKKLRVVSRNPDTNQVCELAEVDGLKEMACSVSPRGRRVYALHKNCSADSSSCQISLQVYDRDVASGGLSSAGSVDLLQGLDFTITNWDGSDGVDEDKFSDSAYANRLLAVSRDGRYVYAAVANTLFVLAEPQCVAPCAKQCCSSFVMENGLAGDDACGQCGGGGSCSDDCECQPLHCLD